MDTGRKSIEVLALEAKGDDATTRFGIGDELRSAVIPDLRLPLDGAFEAVT